MFPLIVIDRRRAEAIEPLGTKSKFWFTDADGRRTLFKAEERGTGEDWAEKIACELAELIGLPHVHYQMALEQDSRTPGVVCHSCRAPGEALAHGNQLLLAADPSYPMDRKRFKVASHTVAAVARVVGRLGPPDVRWTAGTPANVTTAIGAFAGYLMLDAWIANQDRHHENWAAIRRPGSLSLAPSFDHGASLARNLSDDERHERLTSKDRNRQVPAFARRARSAIYGDATDRLPLTTVAAWRAFAALSPPAAEAWLGRLRGVSDDAVRAVLEQVPPDRLSAVAREFTLYLLRENKARLLDGEAQ